MDRETRACQRDAWISSLSAQKNAGYSFGVPKTMDKSGAILGPIGADSFFTGLVYLPASIVAGALWNISPNYAFGFAGVTSAAALAFFISRRANTAGSPV
jgi:hypothetical protein